MKKKEQRINEIMALIREQPTITVKMLAEILNVSEMTVRRDLAYLKSSNALTQSLGMTFINSEPNNTLAPPAYDFGYELHRNTDNKQRIAQKASSLIHSRDILILDSSTTVSIRSCRCLNPPRGSISSRPTGPINISFPLREYMNIWG